MVFVEKMNSTEFMENKFPVEFGLLGVDEFTLKSIFYFRPRSFVSGDSQR